MARDIITRWHGSFIEFWAPESDPKADVDLAAASVAVDKIYKALLAKVEAPLSPSYWADAKVLLPNASVESILDEFPKDKRDAIKKHILNIRSEKPSAVISIHIDQYGLEHFYYQ